jgi:hypothetical protein
MGIAGSASAALWTDASVDSNSWCDANNWDPAAVPVSGTRVDINCTAERGPIVDCDADSGDVFGPGYGSDCVQVMDVVGSIFVISGQWRLAQGAGAQATVNLIDSQVTINGDWRWGDSADSYGIFNVINSTITSKRIKIGDDGGGEINISRGGEVIMDASNSEIDVSSRSPKARFRINGGLLKSYGSFNPESPDTVIDLESGAIECATFEPAGVWAMDINEGSLTVDGNQVAALQNYVDLGRITAYDGAPGSKIHIDWTEDPNVTVVTASTIVTWAHDPSPENNEEDVCPQSVALSWTPGVYADEHEVYFGTDHNSVRDADTTTPVIFRGRQGPNTYDVEPLTTDTTYYWRIDEVNDACAPNLWKGKVWQFTTNDGNAFDPDPADAETGVSIDPTLSWTPGCFAVTHKVYFGSDRDEVEAGTGGTFKGEQGGTTYEPNTLDYLTWYYWRIEEVNAAVTWSGDVWRFRSQSAIVDPNMVLWYELDETAGSGVSDSSGYEHHGALIGLSGPAEWEPNGGRFGGALRFTNEETLTVPSSTLDNMSSAVTVALWVNLEVGSVDEVVVFDAGDSGEDGANKLTATAPDDAGDVVWRAGDDPCDVLVWGDATPQGWRGDWHHFGFVKDENADVIRIYFDGIEVKSRTGVNQTLIEVKGKAFTIGTMNDDASSEHASAFDDVRVFDYALSDGDIAGLFRGGDVEKAWAPTPFNGQADVPRDVNLAWQPGNFAEFHRVYLGTSFDDVNSATTSSDEYKAQKSLGELSYDPPEDLALDTTYYWRIDEVNDPNVWKGDVWKFTVANFVIVDNFESYDTGTNKIFNTWEDGNVNFTGSFIDLGVDPFDVTHAGNQSMLYIYDNTIKWDWDHYWSEGALPFDPAMDFTDADVKVLTLYFYGDPDNDVNDTEEFYVGLTGSLAEVRYTDDAGRDMNDLKVEEWTEWNIPISDFNNPDAVDPCVVTSLLIGFGDRDNTDTVGGEGAVYFDDIRLYPPRCIPQSGPAFDFSGDCLVGWAEIGLMSDVWLKSDKFVSPLQEPNSPLVHYDFNETSGSTVSDSSGNTYHAETRLDDGNSTDAFWQTGGKSGGCIKFDYNQKKYAVQMPTSAFSTISNKITISVWVNWLDAQTMPDETNQMFSMHGGPGAAYDPILGMQTAWRDGELMFWDSSNDTTYDADTDDWSGGWNHYAFVKDVAAEKLQIYLNSDLVSESDSNAAIVLPVDNAWLGMATDEPNEGNWHDEYTGLLDEFKVFDYALSQAEINNLASAGTGYIPLISALNLHDTEAAGLKAINTKDVAELLNHWLEEKLWPE